MADRLSQVAGHLSNSHGRGLLAGEVAIITGAFQCIPEHRRYSILTGWLMNVLVSGAAQVRFLIHSPWIHTMMQY